MEFDILIFIQAAGDTVYALDLLKKNVGKRIHLCVINVKNVYLHLKSLPFNKVKLEFYPYVSLNHKSIISIYNAKKNIKKLFSNHFEHNKYQEIFFFSRFFDWLTPTIISKYISKYPASVQYLNYSDEHAVKTDKKIRLVSKRYFTHKYFITILKFITEVRYLGQYEIRTIEFDYKYYNVESKHIKETVNVPEEFKLRFEYLNSKSILFIISPVELEFLIPYSIEWFQFFLRELKELGYELIIKGHPRLGIPHELQGYFKYELPSKIPIELIDLTKVTLVFGIISSGLSSLVYENDLQVYSLLNVLEFKNSDVADGYKDFLKDRSGNRIIFPQAFDELRKLIEIKY